MRGYPLNRYGLCNIRGLIPLMNRSRHGSALTNTSSRQRILPPPATSFHHKHTNLPPPISITEYPLSQNPRQDEACFHHHIIGLAEKRAQLAWGTPFITGRDARTVEYFRKYTILISSFGGRRGSSRPRVGGPKRKEKGEARYCKGGREGSGI